jgi:hypothetical protein
MAGHPVLSKCRPFVLCKTKRTENFFKCCEGYTLNNRRSPTGDELQSFDVFDKPYK